MGKRKVTSYSLEFKQSSAKLAAESDQPTSTTARDLGVHEATLHGWIRRYCPSKKASVLEINNDTAAELKKLRKENIRLKQERDILKNDHFCEFCVSIQSIETLVSQDDLDSQSQGLLNKLLYANVITSVEAYLSDAFIKVILQKQKFKRSFIEKTQDFQNKKIKYSHLYSELDKLDKSIKKYLFNISWNNMEKVKSFYLNTLGIEFPDTYRELLEPINKRHDIIHRNGKDKNDNELEIEKKDITTLISKAKTFIENVNQQIGTLENYN